MPRVDDLPQLLNDPAPRYRDGQLLVSPGDAAVRAVLEQVEANYGVDETTLLQHYDAAGWLPPSVTQAPGRHQIVAAIRSRLGLAAGPVTQLAAEAFAAPIEAPEPEWVEALDTEELLSQAVVSLIPGLLQDGHLDLSSVVRVPALTEFTDQAEAWRLIIGFLLGQPELGSLIRTVTYRWRTGQAQVPPDVLEWLLPQARERGPDPETEQWVADGLRQPVDLSHWYGGPSAPAADGHEVGPAARPSPASADADQPSGDQPTAPALDSSGRDDDDESVPRGFFAFLQPGADGAPVLVVGQAGWQVPDLLPLGRDRTLTVVVLLDPELPDGAVVTAVADAITHSRDHRDIVLLFSRPPESGRGPVDEVARRLSWWFPLRNVYILPGGWAVTRQRQVGGDPDRPSEWWRYLRYRDNQLTRSRVRGDEGFGLLDRETDREVLTTIPYGPRGTLEQALGAWLTTVAAGQPSDEVNRLRRLYTAMYGGFPARPGERSLDDHLREDAFWDMPAGQVAGNLQAGWATAFVVLEPQEGRPSLGVISNDSRLGMYSWFEGTPGDLATNAVQAWDGRWPVEPVGVRVLIVDPSGEFLDPSGAGALASEDLDWLPEAGETGGDVDREGRAAVTPAGQTEPGALDSSLADRNSLTVYGVGRRLDIGPLAVWDLVQLPLRTGYRDAVALPETEGNVWFRIYRIAPTPAGDGPVDLNPTSVYEVAGIRELPNGIVVVDLSEQLPPVAEPVQMDWLPMSDAEPLPEEVRASDPAGVLTEAQVQRLAWQGLRLVPQPIPSSGDALEDLVRLVVGPSAGTWHDALASADYYGLTPQYLGLPEGVNVRDIGQDPHGWAVVPWLVSRYYRVNVVVVRRDGSMTRFADESRSTAQVIVLVETDAGLRASWERGSAVGQPAGPDTGPDSPGSGSPSPGPDGSGGGRMPPPGPAAGRSPGGASSSEPASGVGTGQGPGPAGGAALSTSLPPASLDRLSPARTVPPRDAPGG